MEPPPPPPQAVINRLTPIPIQTAAPRLKVDNSMLPGSWLAGYIQVCSSGQLQRKPPNSAAAFGACDNLVNLANLAEGKASSDEQDGRSLRLNGRVRQGDCQRRGGGKVPPTRIQRHCEGGCCWLGFLVCWLGSPHQNDAVIRSDRRESKGVEGPASGSASPRLPLKVSAWNFVDELPNLLKASGPVPGHDFYSAVNS